MNGIIYKCFEKDNKDIFYIGSTKNLNQRINSHRTCHKNNDIYFYNYINNNGGFDNFIFEIYEELTNCNDKKLRKREKEIINLLKPHLNTDKEEFRKQILIKAREAKAQKKQIKDANKIIKKLGRPRKISNENENEKSTQTEFLTTDEKSTQTEFLNLTYDEKSTQTEFLNLTYDEIIKLKQIIKLIQC